jgi:hypothetical protein
LPVMNHNRTAPIQETVCGQPFVWILANYDESLSLHQIPIFYLLKFGKYGTFIRSPSGSSVHSRRFLFGPRSARREGDCLFTFANVPSRTTFAVCPPLPRAKRRTRSPRMEFGSAVVDGALLVVSPKKYNGKICGKLYWWAVRKYHICQT